MKKTEFLVVPPEEKLADRATWTQTKNEYVCVRHQIMIVESSGKERKNGPAFSTTSLPTDVTFTSEKKKIRTVKRTEQLTRALESTVSTKLMSEVVSTFDNKTTLKPSGLEVNFGASVQAKVGTEFVESFREALTGASTYEVTETEETTDRVEGKVPKEDPIYRTVSKHVVLRPIFWDIYLVRADVLVLKWHRSWHWTKVRETVRSATMTNVQGLCRITFYVPEPDYAIHFGTYTPEIDENVLVSVEPSSTTPPRNFRRDDLPDLVVYARKAFPTIVEKVKRGFKHGGGSATQAKKKAG